MSRPNQDTDKRVAERIRDTSTATYVFAPPSTEWRHSDDCLKQRDRIAELEEKVTLLKRIEQSMIRYCKDHKYKIAELKRQLEATEKNEEILAEHNNRVRPYLMHRDGCVWAGPAGPYDCTCGLRKALQGEKEMNDLIKRLRRAAGLYDYEERPIINEAADHIEELEARLDQQKDEYEGLIDVAESNYKKLEAKLDAYCKASVMKVDYDKLKKQLENYTKNWNCECGGWSEPEMKNCQFCGGLRKDTWYAKRITELEAQLDAVRDAPVTIKINADGQAWLVFNAGSGAHAMVNLNNIVSEMPQVGINRGICIDALSAALICIDALSAALQGE
jgi:DNA-binding transcriptional MerR regulator